MVVKKCINCKMKKCSGGRKLLKIFSSSLLCVQQTEIICCIEINI